MLLGGEGGVNAEEDADPIFRNQCKSQKAKLLMLFGQVKMLDDRSAKGVGSQNGRPAGKSGQ